ncbi:hypothetical protein HZA97_06365 [Candidatus Woesearchaeota archaeon]|nr:hypothetical protein [Candidatus Woesearchaeota archaeon]
MNKKGAELGLNTIIVAALGLVVLVVLIGFFSGFFGDFTGKIRSLFEQTTPEEIAKTCSYQGGTCVAQGQCSGKILSTPQGGWNNKCEICCVENS